MDDLSPPPKSATHCSSLHIACVSKKKGKNEVMSDAASLGSEEVLPIPYQIQVTLLKSMKNCCNGHSFDI